MDGWMMLYSGGSSSSFLKQGTHGLRALSGYGKLTQDKRLTAADYDN